jgi:eukaryotic-like serine/threonine-protein kinase
MDLHQFLLRPGRLLGGRWQLLRDHDLFGGDGYGSGGCALVWKAQNLLAIDAERELVALKFPKGNFNHRSLLEEARRQRALNDHPHVVKVHDLHYADGMMFLEMELMRGGSLAALLSRQKTLPERRASSIARKVLRALATAHDLGIVHCDVKPPNILFDDRQRAHLTDFGVARLLGDRTRTVTISGTLAYMAPESLDPAQHRTTRKSDVWAVGVTLFRMVAGRLPFESVAATLHQDAPPLPGHFSPAFVAAVQAALTKDETRRPSAVELHEMLQATRRQAA